MGWTRLTALATRRARGDRGSTIPMIIGFAIVLILLIGVVTDVSAAYLRRQSLDTLADGAALQGADLGAGGYVVYSTTGPDDDLDLTSGPARSAVRAYLRKVGAYRRYPSLRIVGMNLTADRTKLHVRLTTLLHLPFSVPGMASTTRVSSTGSATVTLDREDG